MLEETQQLRQKTNLKLPGGASGENPPADAADVKDLDSILGRKIPEGGHGNPSIFLP